MNDIQSNINELKKKIPLDVKLVAVTKLRSVDEIFQAYHSGHKIFGENRVQELLSKKDLLPDDIEWHIIGHLQSNKVKYIVPFISLIHSVDTYKLLKVINSEAVKVGKTVDCLLQFHIAQEETKFGFNIQEVTEMIMSDDFTMLKNIKIRGLMGMATFTLNDEQIRNEFKSLVNYYRILKNEYFKNDPDFREISMGMSSDFEIAIEEGSTMLRLGSIIFGKRNNINQ